MNGIEFALQRLSQCAQYACLVMAQFFDTSTGVSIATNELFIRAAAPGDATRFCALWDVLKLETEGRLFESVTDQCVSITSRQRSQAGPKPGYAHILFVEDPLDNSLVGFVAGTRCQTIDAGNSLEIVIALRQAVANKGWGYRLLCSIESWALGRSFQRLTLHVAASNTPALALYKKCGFVISKTDKESLKTRSGFDSLHTMQKYLHQHQGVLTD